MEELQWITVTDKMITSTGYNISKSNSRNKSLYRRVRKTCAKNKDYRLTRQKIERCSKEGAHSEYKLEMTQTAYEDFVKRTYAVRTPKPKSV